MLVLLKVLALAVLFLGAMREVKTKSWSYIGKSLVILVVFLLYCGLGFWILLADSFQSADISSTGPGVILGFLVWLMVGVVGMVIASPKN